MGRMVVTVRQAPAVAGAAASRSDVQFEYGEAGGPDEGNEFVEQRVAKDALGEADERDGSVAEVRQQDGAIRL